MEFSVDGQPTYVYTGARDFDPSRPSIAFVHGGGLDHCVWMLQSRYLAHHGYNTLALDLPGHGRSAGTPPGSIEHMADWTVRAIDALGVEKFAVAGHSMGALVALEVAARTGERTMLAVLLGISVPMPVTDLLLSAAKANDHAAFDMVNLWGHGYTAQIGGNPSPGMWMTGGAVRLLERSAPGVLHNDLNACNSYTAGLESAKKIASRVHVILGKNDIMASPKAAKAVISALSDVRVTELPNCGHMLMSEQPDRVLEAMVESLGSVMPATAAA